VVSANNSLGIDPGGTKIAGAIFSVARGMFRGLEKATPAADAKVTIASVVEIGPELSSADSQPTAAIRMAGLGTQRA